MGATSYLAAVLIVIAVALTAGCGSGTKGETEQDDTTDKSAVRLPNGVELPEGWTKVSRSVKVAADGEVTDKQITYYISPPPLPMEFVFIPKGTFKMGSPESEECRDDDEKRHTVTITEPFLMSATEVTNEQYRHYFPVHDSRSYKGDSLNGDDQPVVYVRWEYAGAFCRKLTADLSGVLACRLPTEAEWEYACRAGSNTAYSWGDTFRGTWLNFSGKNDPLGPSTEEVNDGYAVTAPVGKFPANVWGLYDMHGNVDEWCSSLYLDYPFDPSKTEDMDATGVRVLRGGSWGDDPGPCRSAYRAGDPPGYSNFRMGFRVVVFFP